MRIHHVGCVSKNISQDLEWMKKIYKIKSISEIIYDEIQDAQVCLIQVEEGLDIELVSGLRVENLRKKKFTYYHLCYETDDIDAEIERFVQADSILISPKSPAKLFDYQLVAFLYTKIGLVELLQTK